MKVFKAKEEARGGEEGEGERREEKERKGEGDYPHHLSDREAVSEVVERVVTVVLLNLQLQVGQVTRK